MLRAFHYYYLDKVANYSLSIPTNSFLCTQVEIFYGLPVFADSSIMVGPSAFSRSSSSFVAVHVD